MRSSDWFAGFVDAEGCFSVTKHGQPRLTIQLRADDLAILELVRAEFGGGLSFYEGRGGRSRPTWLWTGSSKKSLSELVDYFEAHPLRSKKQRDYAIWKRAVVVYRAGGRTDPEMVHLKHALEAVRSFDLVPQPEPYERPQLTLLERAS